MHNTEKESNTDAFNKAFRELMAIYNGRQIARNDSGNVAIWATDEFNIRVEKKPEQQAQ